MRWTCVLLVLLASLGCQTKQLYPGPVRPSEEVAILERGSGRAIVQFTSIDGVEVKGSGFHVLPGGHHIEVTVRVQITLSGGVAQRIWTRIPCTADFVAEAGKTYFVRGDLVDVSRGSLHRSLVPELWVADRKAPQFNIATHRCHP